MPVDRRTRLAASLPVALAGILGVLGPAPALAREVATNGETIAVASVLPTGSPSTSDIRVTFLRTDGAVVGERTLAAGVAAAGLAVATDGTGYLVAWGRELGGVWTVEAARLSGAGALLDAAPVELVSTTAPLSVEGVGAGHDQFLVVWGRVAGTPTLSATALDAVRVSPSGAPLDPSPVTLLGGPVQSPFETSNFVVRDIAWNGTRYLLVHHSRSNYQYGGSIDYFTIGADLDRASIQRGSLRSSRYGGFTGRVASDGSRWLALTAQLPVEGSCLIDANLVTTAGGLWPGWWFDLGRTAFDGDKAAVGWDGREYRVVWGERRPGDVTNLWILQRRTAPDGTALAGAEGVAALPYDHAFLDVACSERTRCLAVCRAPGGLEVLSLDAPKRESSGCASAGAGTLAPLAVALAIAFGRRRRRAGRGGALHDG